jgi:hypothetical protein
MVKRGQSGGIGYQAVIYKSNIQTTPGVPIATTPLANASICMRFTFRSNGQDEYIENREITTDEFGMVNLKIGLVDSPVLGTSLVSIGVMVIRLWLLTWINLGPVLILRRLAINCLHLPFRV